MNFVRTITKAALAAIITGAAVAGTLGFNDLLTPAHQASAASSRQPAPTASDTEHAVETLNSFYNTALKGQFPGRAEKFTIGQTARADILSSIGSPDVPRSSATGFDTYGANMGNPGYAFAYRSNTLSEMRYFGTNVERQTNIGGITMKILKQQWYAPSSTTTITTGKIKQTKLTYIRGDYKLEFIFNSSTDLDHINLTRKG